MPRPKKKPASKVAFVRALPETLSANEVSEKARQAGLKITPGYVYEIRSSAKRKAAKAPIVFGLDRTGKSPADVQFRKLVLDLGIRRAKELLAAVEALAEG